MHILTSAASTNLPPGADMAGHKVKALAGLASGSSSDSMDPGQQDGRPQHNGQPGPRRQLQINMKHLSGPFDIIGDIHGCYDELVELLDRQGYQPRQRDGQPEGSLELAAPLDAGGRSRSLIFLGDLVDRGPKSPAVLRLVMELCAGGQALCVPGNHDDKLMRKLFGSRVKIAHGLDKTLAQLAAEPPAFSRQVAEFIRGLISHFILDSGHLVVAHAGIREEMQGRNTHEVRDFCLYGQTTGETDEFGLPVRYPWARDYRGKALVVYGHTPVIEPLWQNNTINIDTGCVFGGSLCALRYPERELLKVEAREQYAVPGRPIGHGISAG
ncbi:metallophosphoesterase [bacterium]|nr:metallophosphoesterase [bacterium]